MVGEQVEVKTQVLQIIERVTVMVMVEAFLWQVPSFFRRNTQAGEQNISCGRGRELNHGNPLSFRGRG